MVTRHERHGFTWIDLEAPTREELSQVMHEFGIDVRVEEEIATPTPYPLVLSAPTYSFLVLHFPTTRPEGGARNQEIDFIAGKDFLITTRYEVVEAIHSLNRVFEAEELLNLPATGQIGANVVERILRHVYSAIREQLELTARTLDSIEDEIFAGHERKMVRDISLVGRVLLRFDTTLARHREPLKEFLESLESTDIFGKRFVQNAAHVLAEHAHAASLVSSYRAVGLELRNTNESLLTSSQNEAMKVFTFMAFMTFPASLVAVIFGMDTDHSPILGHPFDFWIILGLMVVITLSLLAFFKRKGWV
jgi:magnesium transporter